MPDRTLDVPEGARAVATDVHDVATALSLDGRGVHLLIDTVGGPGLDTRACALTTAVPALYELPGKRSVRPGLNRSRDGSGRAS